MSRIRPSSGCRGPHRRMKRFTPQGLGDGANNDQKGILLRSFIDLAPAQRRRASAHKAEQHTAQYIKLDDESPCFVGYIFFFSSFSSFYVLRFISFYTIWLFLFLLSSDPSFNLGRLDATLHAHMTSGCEGAWGHQCGTRNIDLEFLPPKFSFFR